MGLIELTATEQLKPIRLFSLSRDFMDVVSPRVSPNLIKKNRHLDHLPVVSKPKGLSADGKH